MTSNKTAGGSHLLLVTDNNELLSTSLRNNTTQKIKMPSSIVPEEVSFVTTNRNHAIIITKTSIAIWDILQSKIIRKIEGVFSQIRDFACTPINEQLACAVGNQSTVKLIDLVQGKIIQGIEIPHEHISCVTFSPNGKSLYLGSLTGNILETNLSNFNTEVYSEVEESDSDKLQGGVFKLKIVPDSLKFESLEMTKTSVTSEDESDASSMNFSEVSVEEPTPTTSKPSRKPLSQIQSQVLKSQKRKLQLSPMANEGSPMHKSPVGLTKQPMQASTPLANDLRNENRFFSQAIEEPTTNCGYRRHSVLENDTEMESRSPTELGRQISADPVLTSEISALLKTQNSLITTLVNRQTALEEKIKRQDELLTKMSNYLLPEDQTPKENWYWAKEWNDAQKYERPDGHPDAARPDTISHSDKAILDKSEELVIDRCRYMIFRQFEKNISEIHYPNFDRIEALVKNGQINKADTSRRLDRLETLLENLCRASHVRIPFPRPDNKVPWE